MSELSFICLFGGVSEVLLKRPEFWGWQDWIASTRTQTTTNHKQPTVLTMTIKQGVALTAFFLMMASVSHAEMTNAAATG